jgi:hypothetical protein
MDGDVMSRIFWKMIKEKLLFPSQNGLKYFDLGVKHRTRPTTGSRLMRENAVRNTASA